MAREARIRVTTTGEQRVLRMLRGIVSASRRAEHDVASAHQQAEHEQERADQAAVRSTRRAEEARRRERRRTSDEQRHSIDAELREVERSARQRRRQRVESIRAGEIGGARVGPGGPSGFSQMATAAAGLVSVGAVLSGVRDAIGVYGANLERVSSALASAGGVQDLGQRTVTAQEFERNLERLGGEVLAPNLTDQQTTEELQAIQNEINQIALATNQEPGALLEALANLQTEFSAFEFGRRNLRAMAEESQRLGMDIADVARFAGLVNQQMGELDTGRMMDITAQAGLQGALDPASLSHEFAGQLGLFQTFADPNHSASSEENFRSFVATANTLQTSGLSPAENATLMQNMMASLSDRRVQGRIRRASGVDIRSFRNEEGRLDVGGFVEALQASGRFNDFETIRGAVHDQQATQALNVLISARSRNIADPENNADIRELEQVDAVAGAAFRERNLGRIQRTAAERMAHIGVQSQVEGQMSNRDVAGELAAGTGENLRAMGPLGEIMAETNLLGLSLPNLAGAIGASDTGRQFMSGDMGRWLVERSRRTVAEGDATGLEATVAALSGAMEQRGGLLAGGKTAGGTDEKRLGGEVASAIRNGGPIPVQVVGGAGSLGTTVDQSTRGPGGPARR